jgi:hypothetical protein
MTDHQAQAGTPDPVDDTMRYLMNGGLFNPESMDHEQVRDLVMRLRTEVYELRRIVGYEREAAERCAAERDHYRKQLEEVVLLRANAAPPAAIVINTQCSVANRERLDVLITVCEKPDVNRHWLIDELKELRGQL